jgi:hypothetical protein
VYVDSICVQLRVTSGEVEGMEEEELIAAITKALDCALVHKIGFTFTFYRSKALPPIRRQAGGSDANFVDYSLETKEEGKARRRLERKQKVHENQAPGPPEFSVIED